MVKDSALLLAFFTGIACALAGMWFVFHQAF